MIETVYFPQNPYKKNLAIIISTNPAQFKESPSEADRADIESHKKFAEEKGHTWWNIPGRGETHVWINEIKAGYFSEPIKRVTYRFEILEVNHYRTKDEMRTKFPKEEVDYLLGSRKMVWEIEKRGGYNWKEAWTNVGKWGFIFFKIRNIQRLSQERKLEDFKKAFERGLPVTYDKAKPVKANREYVIVFDEGYY